MEVYGAEVDQCSAFSSLSSPSFFERARLGIKVGRTWNSPARCAVRAEHGCPHGKADKALALCFCSLTIFSLCSFLSPSLLHIFNDATETVSIWIPNSLQGNCTKHTLSKPLLLLYCYKSETLKIPSHKKCDTYPKIVLEIRHLHLEGS